MNMAAKAVPLRRRYSWPASLDPAQPQVLPIHGPVRGYPARRARKSSVRARVGSQLVNDHGEVERELWIEMTVGPHAVTRVSSIGPSSTWSRIAFRRSAPCQVICDSTRVDPRQGLDAPAEAL